jgi:5-methylcytosine-specific restriction enzyme A
MPWAPARPCAAPGCPALVKGGSRCERHRLPRLPPGWNSTSRRYLASHPVCVVCGGRAQVVDHVVARKAGGADHPSNYAALCKPCHSAKTCQVDGGFGHTPR